MPKLLAVILLAILLGCSDTPEFPEHLDVDFVTAQATICQQSATREMPLASSYVDYFWDDPDGSRADFYIDSVRDILIDMQNKYVECIERMDYYSQHPNQRIADRSSQLSQALSYMYIGVGNMIEWTDDPYDQDKIDQAVQQMDTGIAILDRIE